MLELLCKNGVQGQQFCGQTAPQPAAAVVANIAAATRPSAKYYYPSVEGREIEEEDEEKVGGSVAVTQSAAVQQLFTGLPVRLGNTLCGLGVWCP